MEESLLHLTDCRRFSGRMSKISSSVDNSLLRLVSSVTFELFTGVLKVNDLLGGGRLTSFLGDSVDSPSGVI